MIGGNERRGRKCKISTAYRRNSRVFNALNWEPFLGLRRMHGTIENASEKERRKGNAEREPGAIAIQYGAPMTCICISPSRGLVIIAMGPLASCSLSFPALLSFLGVPRAGSHRPRERISSYADGRQTIQIAIIIL